MGGCYVDHPTTPTTASDDGNDTQFRRPLVTDELPYQIARAEVRHWHVSHGWCVRRVWPSTDEFVVCDQLTRTSTRARRRCTRWRSTTPPATRSAYATFTPVPCRMYGRCDVIYGRTVYGGRARLRRSSARPLRLISPIAAALPTRRPLVCRACSGGCETRSPSSCSSATAPPHGATRTATARRGRSRAARSACSSAVAAPG